MHPSVVCRELADASPLAGLEICALSAGNTPLSDPTRVAGVLGAFAPKRGPSYEKNMTTSDPSEINRATPILSGASPAPKRGKSHEKQMTNSDPWVGHGGQAGANARQMKKPIGNSDPSMERSKAIPTATFVLHPFEG